MKINSLQSNLVIKAKEIGFTDIGFAKADILNSEIENYKSWIDMGYNADMKWMENNLDKRANPEIILPEIKSVIVTAHSYFTGIKHNSNTGKISRYAWGDDYHKVVLEKLKVLEQFLILNVSDIKLKSYVDTGPILEKQWAKKAGIGWQGKNSLIINRGYGSYFFIGIIFTNQIFEYSKPEIESCGSCNKCINHCPTNAIIADKIVDANKCISYWTIEAKPDIPLPSEITDNLSGWSFGCDICQEVCPWNKNNPIITHDNSFYPRNNITNLLIEDIENISDEDFREKFRNSPIKRAKLAGLKRNIIHKKLE